jgi:TP901 family phage tail tape measure protein
MSAFTVPTIFSAVDKLSAPMRKMEKNTLSFTQKASLGVTRLDRRLRKLTPSLGNMGKQMLQFASAAAIGTLLVSSVQTLKEYETNMASLSAITGVSGSALEVFRGEVNNVAKDTKKSSVEVAKAFELVGSAKPELLKNAEALAEVTRQSIILSKASGDELEISVQSLTGTLNQFDLGADSAARVINALAAGSKEGAAAVPLITESLDKFGTVAAGMNISVEQSVGLIETLAEKNLKGAEAGNKLKNVLAIMSTAKALPPKALQQLEKFGVNAEIVSDKTLPLSTRLKELGKIAGDETALVKVFGRENFVAGGIILKNAEKVNKYTKAVTGTNIAQEQADKNSNTLSNRLTEMSNAWDNVLTSSGSATGSMGLFKDLIVLITDNLSGIVAVIGTLTAVFIALKIGVFAAQFAMGAYNAVLIISNILTGTMTKRVASSEIAIMAYAAAQWLANTSLGSYIIAQIGANAALWAFPLVWIIAGIVALIGFIALIIIYWDDFGAALLSAGTIVVAFFSSIFFWVGIIVSVVASFGRNWDNIVDAFTNGGIIDGLLMIGATILDVLLYPLQQILEVAESFTGMDLGASGLKDFRASMGLDVTSGDEPTETLNPEEAKQNSLVEKITENTNKETLDLNVNVTGQDAEVTSGGSANNVNLKSTMTGGQ